MNEKRFIEFFQQNDWQYLLVEGSSLGNTSFLTQFIKVVLLAEITKEANELDKLLDEQLKILYFRPESVDSREKDKLNKMANLSLLEFIDDEEVFDAKSIIKYIQNRPYNYLILDDNRKKYDESPFKMFNELLTFCEDKQTKVIVSVTDNRQQKMDYRYHDADLILNVKPYILDNNYAIDLEQRGIGYKSFQIPMK